MLENADVIIIGAGLSGLVAAHELTNRGKRVVILDQENENNLGGQAFWSLGGLFMIDTPEQRRMYIKDNLELARHDWFGSAQFDHNADYWSKQWADAFLNFAHGEMHSWLYGIGMRWFPVVGWAERGGGMADGHGNSVPRFHITWGTGPGILKPFIASARKMHDMGVLQFRYRHRVSQLLKENGAVTGVAGEILAPSDDERGQPSNRDVVGEFELRAKSVIVASGGFGGNLDMVKKNWPTKRIGKAPENMLLGAPGYIDGSMFGISQQIGANVVNQDRMWHYSEGVKTLNPIWPDQGVRIIPGPSSMWLDAFGKRLPAPCFPGFDSLETLKQIMASGKEYSWFILNQKIIEKEFILSGSNYNPDLTSGKWKEVIKTRLGDGAAPSVQMLKLEGEDFLVRNDLASLVEAMNKHGEGNLIEYESMLQQIEARDMQVDNPYTKDAQIMAIHNARNNLGDKLVRTTVPHKILDPDAGPLIAVKMHILTRKTLGGLQTNLESQALDEQGNPIEGLYAVGEAAGFGGGGFHGHNALEGTFLGGCLFSGRIAGMHAG